jgi:uncharacterized membrane protein YdbT with pleckstrin-like domain
MANTTETIIWEGSESQVLNLGTFIIALILCIAIAVLSVMFFPLMIVLVVVPLSYFFYHWLLVKSRKYKVTSERIFFTSGIFSKKTDALELYRVKDIDLYEPFVLRMFKRGNLEIDSSDESSPRFFLKAIPNPKELMDKIRTNVEKRRDAKGVRGVDFMQDYDVQNSDNS